MLLYNEDILDILDQAFLRSIGHSYENDHFKMYELFDENDGYPVSVWLKSVDIMENDVRKYLPRYN